jgi:hypothetical protein
MVAFSAPNHVGEEATELIPLPLNGRIDQLRAFHQDRTSRNVSALRDSICIYNPSSTISRSHKTLRAMHQRMSLLLGFTPNECIRSHPDSANTHACYKFTGVSLTQIGYDLEVTRLSVPQDSHRTTQLSETSEEAHHIHWTLGRGNGTSVISLNWCQSAC